MSAGAPAHAVVARQLLGHAVVEVRRLPAEAVYQQDGRPGTRLAHVQARARHLDEASFWRQEGVDAVRGAVAEPHQTEDHQCD